MGIGIFAVWPLARRFGKRNVTLAGFILYAAGGMICWMHPTNMTIMLIGQLIKNIGGLPLFSKQASRHSRQKQNLMFPRSSRWDCTSGRISLSPVKSGGSHPH